MQYIIVQYIVIQQSNLLYSIAQYDIVQCSIVWCIMLNCGIVWCSVALYDESQYIVAQYVIVQHSIVSVPKEEQQNALSQNSQERCSTKILKMRSVLLFWSSSFVELHLEYFCRTAVQQTFIQINLYSMAQISIVSYIKLYSIVQYIAIYIVQC